MTPHEIEERLQSFDALCREQGIPLTVQRREVLRAVLERSDHPSPDQIYESVRERVSGLSRTTVYRALDALCQLGVIQRLHHPGTAARFDGNVDRHHHMICRICNCVMDVEASSLDDLTLPSPQRRGFEIEDYSVHFRGICKECTSREAKRT